MAENGMIATELSRLGIEGLDPVAVLDRALAHGGALAELFFERTASTRVTFEGGKVEEAIDGTDRGVGLRVIYSNRSVYGYTTDLSQASVMRLAEALSSAVRTNLEGAGEQGGRAGIRPGIEWRRAEQRDAAMASYAVKRSPRSLNLKERIELARQGDAAAREALPSARQVSSTVLDSRRQILVVNSDGLVAPDEKTYFTFFVEVVGEKDGRVETGRESEGGYMGLELLDEVTPADVGRRAAERVRILLGAKPAPAGTMPVVISAEAGGTMIHEAVGHGLEADLACNGLSVYQGKLDQQVASPLVTVIDDGTMPGKRGSYALDDEGTPSRRNVLIDRGVLRSYMVDRLSAMKFDLMATGNGRRQSFRHKPIVRMTNTYIAPGADDPEAIVRDTKWGMFVKSMGGGQVNTVTGDFVFAVTEGYVIRDGRIAEPVRGATLVGNGPRVLSIIDRVGNDLGFSIGTCGKDGQGAPVTDAQPTLRVPELTVGGEVPSDTYWPTR